jgi:hypothetical protein
MLAASEPANYTQGLCVTCVHYPACEHCHEEGIFYCDNYEDHTSAIESPRMHGDSAPPKVQNNGERLMGLCVNCERRAYCTNARRLGGVWVCEEYL